MKSRECSNCGTTVRIGKVDGLCSDCRTDARCPTPKQIAEECCKIREEGPPNRVDTGLGPYEGEFRQPRVYRTPRL